MSLIYLISFLIIVGVLLAFIPMDATIRRWVLLLIAILVVLSLLGFFFRGMP